MRKGLLMFWGLNLVASFVVLSVVALAHPPPILPIEAPLPVRQIWITQPRAGITANVHVISVYDGDTITVEIKQRVKVRLLDCWAPEVRGKERSKGLVSRDALRNMIDNRDVVLHVPTAKAKHVGDVFSFGRVLGHVWASGDKKSVSQRMVEGGHATRKRSTTR